MNLENYINRKFILVIITLIVIGSIVNFFLTHSLLTIESSANNEKTVYVKGEGYEKTITLKDSSKKLLLKSGAYKIEVVDGDEQTIYGKKLGFFSLQKLSIETSPQKNSAFLGQSFIGCARQGEGGIPIYYSCYPSSLGSIVQASTKPVETSDDFSQSADLINSLKARGQHFLEAKISDNKVLLTERTTRIDDPGKQLTTIADFNGEISDQLFSVDNQSRSFALFDNVKSSLYYSNGEDASKYSSLVIDKKLFPEKNPKYVSTYNTPNYVYLLSLISEEETANNPEGSQAEHTHKPKIVVIDKKRKKIAKEVTLPIDWEIKSVNNGPQDNLIIFISAASNQNTYSLNAGGKVELLTSFSESPQQACTVNNDLYYVADGGRKIYKYIDSKEASFLVYSSDNSVGTTISCTENLYFSFTNDKDDETGMRHHYALGNDNQVGPRLSTVLPIFLTIEQDTLKISEGAGGVLIESMFDSNRNGPPSKETTRVKLTELLGEKGINSKDINITFAY